MTRVLQLALQLARAGTAYAAAGAVENVEFATSTGFPKLDEAALAAARSWTRPAR